MPEQAHPPYNITQPRVLQRWLDINSQNGPLARCNKYITIPVFNIDADYTWIGYSDIMAAYVFVAPNSFTILNPEDVPQDSNYYLTISYIDSDGSTIRYSLNRDVGEILFTDHTPYTNQRIKKNFRLEFWNIADQNIVQSAAIYLYTSIKTQKDTRYGLDEVLATPSLDTIFSYVLGTVDAQNRILIFPNTLNINT